MGSHVQTMSPKRAAEVLQKALGRQANLRQKSFTIADAAAAAGLSLREAEQGLHQLVANFRGVLSATDKGELLFRFPYGFTLPLGKRPAFRRFLDRVKRGALGVGKFLVRAWISIVLIGYVGVFLAIALALAFARQNNDERNNNGFAFLYVLTRIVSEALFWTFHPFSPFAYGSAYEVEDSYGRSWQRRGRREQKVPFYERVNRFVFGPEDPPHDPQEMERRILAQIRASQGRIGISDVMRVTGLSREEADPLMARLMLDYEGDVEVSDDGAITWRFPNLRRSATQQAEAPPAPVWTEKMRVKPTTGNPTESNFLIAGLNAFNLVASTIALQADLTLDRLSAILHQIQTAKAGLPTPPLPPADGTPLVLGVIPFLFSTVLFALPIWRWATAGRRQKKIARENGRRAVLKTILERTGKGGVDEAVLKKAWADAAGEPPSDEQLVREVVELGGDVDMESGRARYRFRDLEAEVAALQKERQAAAADEVEVGKVVFSSDS